MIEALETYQKILIGLIIVAIVYIVSKKLNKKKTEYDLIYEKLVTSKEYKVKGQHD